MSLGYLSRLFGGEMRGALTSEAIVKTVGLLAYLMWIRESRFKRSLPIVFGAVIIYVSLSASQGRPELLAAILILMWGLADRHGTTERWRIAMAACFLGLLGITQPTVAAIASVWFLVILLTDGPPRQAVKAWIAANMGAFLILLLLSSMLYPYSLFEWFNGLLQQATNVANRNDDGALLKYWFASPERPLHGVFVLGSVLAIGWAGRRQGVRSLFFLSWCTACWFLWYMSMRIPALVYNAAVFVPWAVVALMARHGGRERHFWRELLVCGVAVVSSLAIFSRPYAILSGGDRVAFVRDIDNLRANTPGQILLSAPLLVGAVPFHQWSAYRVLEIGNAKICNKGSKQIINQANSGRFIPPELTGCQLLEDRFVPPLVPIVPLVPKSYGYAVYIAK